MAQSGFTPIQLYRSATPAAVPTAGNLLVGELALNYADGRLYFEDSGGSVTLLAAASGALGSVTSVAASGGSTGLTFTGSPITSSGTLTLGGTLAVTNGGTGATTASGARTNLGASTVGGNFFTLTNPSAVTFPRINADNTVSALDAASFRAAIGAGSGGGSVTSVDVSGGTTGLSFSGGPITTSGTITMAGTLAVANGGTGTTTSTGTGSVVLNNNPVLTGSTTVSTLVLATGSHLIYGDTSEILAFRISADGPFVTLADIGSSAVALNNSSGGNFDFRIGGASRLQLGSDGSLSTNSGSLGTTAGNSFNVASFTGFNSNAASVQYRMVRTANGTDWTTTALRLQSRIDVSDKCYIDLLTNGASNDMAFGTGDPAAERMRISGAGNVGIGTTGGDFGRTWRFVARQDQNATSNFGFINGGTGASAAVQLSRIGGTGNSFCDWTLSDNSGSPFDGFNYGSAVAHVQWAFGGSERMRLTSGGNLGIGTSTPQGLFHVVANTDSSILVRGPINFATGGSVYSVNAANSALAPLELTGSTIGMLGGSVGINTASPAELLHVAGGNIRLDNTRAMQFRNAANTANAYFVLQGDDNFVAYNAAGTPVWNFTQGAAPTAAYGANGSVRMTADAGAQRLGFVTNGSERAAIDSAGTFTYGGIEVGYRSIPRRTTTTTIVTGDRGGCVALTAGITIPNSTFAAGDAVSLYNTTASPVTITQGSGLTLRQGGTANTGNRTLAAYGMATVWFNTASEAVITGAGVS